MPRDLDSQSRDLLNFRPNIDFVEPDVLPAAPNPVAPPPPIIDDGAEAERVRLRLFNLADSVEILATAVQAKIDAKAIEMRIKLDPKVDAAAIAAVRRHGGDDEIDYELYKHCRDMLRAYADQQAAKNRITQEQIDAAREGLDKFDAGFGSLAAKNGTLRPELSPKAQLVEPLDLDKFQNLLIRILVNFIWKKFIKPTFKPIRIPGLGSVAKLLPDKLVKIPKSFEKQLDNLEDSGLPVL
jgi:hypothetical protein